VSLEDRGAMQRLTPHRVCLGVWDPLPFLLASSSFLEQRCLSCAYPTMCLRSTLVSQVTAGEEFEQVNHTCRLTHMQLGWYEKETLDFSFWIGYRMSYDF
jgi:hypothetical protein